MFRQVRGDAVRSRMLSVNPPTDIDLPRKPGSDKRYLTHQQVADLAAECREHDVLVLAYCGLRWGEAAALKRRNIDFERARLKVNSSVERVNGHYRLGPTKTHERREVPIPAPLLTLLRDRVESWSPDRPVFPDADGYLKNHEFRKVFDPGATKAPVAGLSLARAAAHMRVAGESARNCI
jgi:integrase